jgi:dUTP pyrophosphatase
MKIKIYVKIHNEKCKLESFGNWIDLRSSETISLKKFESKLIDLGVSMKLPKYYQGNIVPRSGTYKNFKMLQTNHYGVVDGPTKITSGYSGNNDRWKFSALAIEDTYINEGDRICQFEIKPTMFAPFLVKLKWLFSSGIEIIYVDNLSSEDRGGFGSTGKN